MRSTTRDISSRLVWPSNTRATGREIKSHASAKGFRTLADDAIARVLLGQTSLEEISRVVDLTDRVI